MKIRLINNHQVQTIKICSVHSAKRSAESEIRDEIAKCKARETEWLRRVKPASHRTAVPKSPSKQKKTDWSYKNKDKQKDANRVDVSIKKVKSK